MARLRSPNYPGISLPKSVKLAEEIYKRNHQNVITREAAAKDIGYSGLTGRSIKLLAALNQYGLLEKSGKGNVRVSDRAKSLIYDVEPGEKLAAAKAAGREPQLFADIFERFPEDARSPNAIRSLLGQLGFTEKAMDPAITSFEETNQYIEILEASESYGDEEESDAESTPDNDEGNEKMQQPTGLQNAGKVAPAPAFVNNAALDINFNMREVQVSGKTNSPEELQAFIDDLAALKTLLKQRAERSGD